SVRDQVFEVLMMRFDIMTPYKAGLKSIAHYLRCHPGQASAFACSRLVSQYWTLSSVGVKLKGPSGAVRVAGLSAVYGKAFNVWLKDDSETLDKTMVTLDRGLKNGEKALQRAEKICSPFCGLVRGLRRNFMQKDDGPDDKPSPSPEPAPTPV
ncbi:MAG: hypothetical protein AAF405_09950, partial [Pseudomonadota bacterium]